MFSLSNYARVFGFHVKAVEHPHLTSLYDRDLKVGLHHFRDQHGEDRVIKVNGNLASLDHLSSDIFAAGDVHPTIRKFFEHTSKATLAYVGRQSPFINTLHRFAYDTVFSRIGQLAIPPISGTTEYVKGNNFAVDVDGDHVADYRVWQRHQEGKIFYLSAIKVIRHTWHPPYLDRPLKFNFLVFSFPLPRSNISVVLAPRNLPRGGMELSSTEPFDQSVTGSYVVLPHARGHLSFVRVPLIEHFVFDNVDGRTFRALHSQFLGKQLLFRLDYHITMPDDLSDA